MANKKRIPMTLCLTFSSEDKLFIGPEEKYDIPYTIDLAEVNLSDIEDDAYFYPSMESLQENDVLIMGLARIAESLMKYDPLILDMEHLFIDSPDIHGLRKYGFIFLQFLMLNTYKYCIDIRFVANDTVPIRDNDIRYYTQRLHKSMYLLIRDFEAPAIENFVKNVRSTSENIRYMNINKDEYDNDLYEQFQKEKIRIEQVERGKIKMEEDRKRYMIKHKSQAPLKEQYIWPFNLLDKEISEYLNVRLSEDELKNDEALSAVNIVLNGIIPLRDSKPDEYKDILTEEETKTYIEKSVINYLQKHKSNI